MGAFDRGFQMGSSLYERELDRRRQAEIDARNKELHGLQVQGAQLGLRRTEQQIAEGDRTAALNAQVDDLRTQLTGAPEKDLPGPVPPTMPEGMEGRRAAGLVRPPVAAAQGAQRYDVMSRMAALQGQYGMAADLDARRQKTEDDEFMRNTALEWQKLTPEQRQQARAEFFDNPEVPMYATAPSKSGKFSVIVKGADKPVELDASDEAAMFVAARLFQRNPMAALDMMRNTSDRLRTVANQLNETLFRVTGVNNDVTAREMAAENDAARTGIARASLGIQQGQFDQGRIGALQWMRDPKTGQVQAFIPSVVGGKVSLVPFKTPEGMVPFNRQQIDPKVLSEIAANYVQMGMDPEAAMMRARTDMGGEDPWAKALELLKQSQAAKQGGKGAPAAAPAPQLSAQQRAMFEAMPDAELQKLAQAGNQIARAVAAERAQAAASQAQAQGLRPLGY